MFAGDEELRAQMGRDNARLLRTVFGASEVERRHTVLPALVEDDARAGSPCLVPDGRFRVPLAGVRTRTPAWSRRPACRPRPPEALRESRDVLTTRGRMSSVTVLHVLRQVIEDAPADETRSVCALAFGPGLTVESALFTIPARTAAPAAELDPAAAVPIRQEVSVDHDVVVVGAGLAGLQCAHLLERHGLDVVVLEASDGVGGRVRTDVVSGFRCDRGFQVLNPAYTELRRNVDVAALGIQKFDAAAGVRRSGGIEVLADPRRVPSRLAGTLRSPLVELRRLPALAAWLALGLDPRTRRQEERDRAWHDSFDAAGVRGPLRDLVLEPFLAGVILEDEGGTSAAFVRELVGWFLLGTPGLPAEGMAALPAWIHDRLRAPAVLGTRVESVERTGNGWTVGAGGTAWRAPSVVVATEGPASSRLLGLPDIPMKGEATWWFAAESAPSELRCLVLPGESGGPLIDTAVVSNAAPSYAPDGRALIQATALLPRGAELPTEADVRRQLGAIWSADTVAWDLLTVHEVRGALPEQPPGLVADRPASLGDGLYVCGDHRTNGSTQGALRSGRRAAEALLA